MNLLGTIGKGEMPDINTNVEITEKNFFLMFAYGVLITASIVLTIEILKGVFRLVKK
jgi:hypothetical protein